MKNEYVTYKNRRYRVSSPVDYPDKGLLTVRKQRMALFLINQGLSLEVISEKLAVSRELLYIWYTEYLKTENISDANNSRKKNGGVRKKVVATNIETGDTILFESVADCARFIKCADSTVSLYARSGRKYGKWLFKYVEE